MPPPQSHWLASRLLGLAGSLSRGSTSTTTPARGPLSLSAGLGTRSLAGLVPATRSPTAPRSRCLGPCPCCPGLPRLALGWPPAAPSRSQATLSRDLGAGLRAPLPPGPPRSAARWPVHVPHPEAVNGKFVSAACPSAPPADVLAEALPFDEAFARAVPDSPRWAPPRGWVSDLGPADSEPVRELQFLYDAFPRFWTIERLAARFRVPPAEAARVIRAGLLDRRYQGTDAKAAARVRARSAAPPKRVAQDFRTKRFVDGKEVWLVDPESSPSAHHSSSSSSHGNYFRRRR